VYLDISALHFTDDTRVWHTRDETPFWPFGFPRKFVIIIPRLWIPFALWACPKVPQVYKDCQMDSYSLHFVYWYYHGSFVASNTTNIIYLVFVFRCLDSRPS
jgi:hypothetical protein